MCEVAREIHGSKGKIQRRPDSGVGAAGASDRYMAGMRRAKERVKQQRKGDER